MNGLADRRLARMSTRARAYSDALPWVLDWVIIALGASLIAVVKRYATGNRQLLTQVRSPQQRPRNLPCLPNGTSFACTAADARLAALAAMPASVLRAAARAHGYQIGDATCVTSRGVPPACTLLFEARVSHTYSSSYAGYRTSHVLAGTATSQMSFG